MNCVSQFLGAQYVNSTPSLPCANVVRVNDFTCSLNNNYYNASTLARSVNKIIPTHQDEGHYKGHHQSHNTGHYKGTQQCHQPAHQQCHQPGHQQCHQPAHQQCHQPAHQQCRPASHRNDNYESHSEGHYNIQVHLGMPI